ncbi:MAG: hypothetical protein RI894_972 [Bacteroidota bacterium]|jgi:hypothetical protein
MKIIFPTEEFEQRCREQQIIGETFLIEAFNFWLHDNPDLRTPFPMYIQEPLVQNTFQRLMHWAFLQDASQTDEDEISQIFQAVITEEAAKLVQTDDERLTILYPEFPRIGDKTTVAERGTYTVCRRYLQDRNGQRFLKVYLMNDVTKGLLDTEYEVF